MNECYELYMKSFPDYPTSPGTFQSVLRPDLAQIADCRDNGRLLGFALVHPGSIPILCVDLGHRGKGIGSALLAEGEQRLRSMGCSKVTIGCGPHYLLQGVPDGPAVDFFHKRGYTAGWTSINMELGLAGFDPASLAIPPAPAGLQYRFAGKSDVPALLKAVEAAKPGWAGIFAHCSDPILLSEIDGKIAGFEILSPDGGYFTRPGHCVGSVGCVGVVANMRERGIGLSMVAEGCSWLKAQGSTTVELRYTWLEGWYGKLGFHTVSRQWMGERDL